MDLSAERGKDIGYVVFAALDAGGGLTFTSLDLKVDDPTAYASDPAVQSCAPGTHAAAWSGSGWKGASKRACWRLWNWAWNSGSVRKD